jgi:hypothetical protein
MSEKESISTNQNRFDAFFYPGPTTVASSFDKIGKPPGYLRRNVAGMVEYEDQENLKITDDGFVCIFTEKEVYNCLMSIFSVLTVLILPYISSTFSLRR